MHIAPLAAAAAMLAPLLSASPTGRPITSPLRSAPANAAEPTPLRARSLHPASFRVKAGEAVALTLRSEAGAPEAWPPASWMFTRVASTQRNADEPPRDANGEATATLDAPGVGMIGIDFAPRELRVRRADLRAFIAQRGRSAAGPAALEGDAPATLRRVESVKLLLRAGEPRREAGASEATGKSGQQAEIRPLMDPLATPVGGAIALRCYAGGSSPGARLIATHEPSGQRQESTADASAIARFTLTAPGVWRIEFHELRAAEEPWTLYSATLTFEAPGPEKRP